MKNATKFLGIIILAAAGFCLIACPTDGSKGGDGVPDDGSFSLATLKTPDGVKSVYLSDIAVNGSGRAAAGGDPISSLSYISSDGHNAPVLFSTPAGKKQFIFDVTNVEQLGERCIIITITGYYEVTSVGAAGSYTVGDKVATDGSGGYWDEKTETWVENPRIDSVLIDMKNSKLYDFSEFQNRYGDSQPRFMEGNIIYTLINYSYSENKQVNTVYKIDMSTASVDSALKAEPLNNSALMPIRNIQLPYTINNKLIGNKNQYDYDRMCLDLAKVIQPEPYKYPVLPKSTFTGNYSSQENSFGINIWESNKLIRDLTGKPWVFIMYNNNTNYSISGPFSSGSNNVKNYLTAEVSIADSGQCNLDNVKDNELSFDVSTYFYDWDSSTNEIRTAYPSGYPRQIYTFNAARVGNAIIDNKSSLYTYNNNGVATLYSNGFVRLHPEVDGIKVESAGVTLPTSLEGKSVISPENYLFWLEDKTIKRQKLEAGSSPQTVYSNSGIADNYATRDLLTASGRKIIFYQYATATEVHTYSLDMYNPNAEPELLATNDAEVRSIVELDF